ncbi:MAG: hypothetical protein WDO12_09535 [Pseudomonadota bacterium]
MGTVRVVALLMLTPASIVAILGFGPRARCFAALLAPRGCALRAWDPAPPDAGAAVRAHIEAAGVDAVDEPDTALRGARLVVLDTVPMTGTLHALLQPGQKVLDLRTAAAADIDAVLVALGVPPAAACWATHEAALAGAVANSATADPHTPLVRRGELP